jgi:hypothetical protein
MATTDTGFTFKYNLHGTSSGAVRQIIIASSQTISVGDLVLINNSGFVSVATAGNPIFGVVVALVDVNGVDMENSRVTKDGTYTASTRTYVASASNQTGAKFSAVVNSDKNAVWSAQPDAAIGTTTSSGNSAFLGSYTDIISAGQPDENNAGNSFATAAQLFIHGVDPDNTAHGLYSIKESML